VQRQELRRALVDSGALQLDERQLMTRREQARRSVGSCQTFVDEGLGE
jgi:hypothetical protein